MNFKISPLWLFLLLLIVLIIPTMFIKPLINKENFIDFYGKTDPSTTGLTIPNYPNPVDKLYDNDFFDSQNGNLLRVYSAALNEKSSVQDTSGATIDHIDLIERSTHTTTFTNGQPITSGSLTTVPSSYLTWTAYSTDPKFSTITSNQVLYCPWGQDTYIHVFNLNRNLNACGFLYLGSGSAPIYTNYNSIYTLGTARADNNPSNRTYVMDQGSKLTMYQLTSQISYVPSTGDMRFLDAAGNNMIYNRSGQMVSAFTTKGLQASMTPWIEYDLVGNLMMIYMPNQTKTTIMIMKLNPDGITFAFVCVCRFNADGALQVDENTIIPIPANLAVSSGGSGCTGASVPAAAAPAAFGGIAATPSAIGGIATTPSGAGDVSYTNQQITDYILKTQIIPPICPACAQCPNVIVSGSSTPCPSCGAAPSGAPVGAPAPAPSGGDRSGSPVAGTPSGFYSGLKEFGHETKEFVSDTGSGAKNLLEKTGSGTKNLLEDTGSGAKDLLEDTGSGVTNLARETGSGAANILRDVGGGITGLAREAGSGAVGFTRDVVKGTVSGIKGIGHEVGEIFREDDRDRYIRRDGGYGDRDWEKRTGGGGGVGGGAGGAGGAGAGTGSYAQGVQAANDPFSYMGAIENRGSSTFIPITADFSKFSK